MRPVLVLLASILAAGCGTAGDRTEARAVVERFYDAVRQGDGEGACVQLSAAAAERLEQQSGQGCEEAVTRLDYVGGAIVGAEVYVTGAKVDLRGGESAFLDKDSTGWRITAAGCRPEQGRPRERPWTCELEA